MVPHRVEKRPVHGVFPAFDLQYVSWRKSPAEPCDTTGYKASKIIDTWILINAITPNSENIQKISKDASL